MLELEALTSGYGESLVVREISMKVPKGSLVAVMGSNGVGKTTVMKTILGLIKPASGKIIWNGEDITKLPSYERARRGIGYVPQGRDIFPFLTVQQNLILGIEARGKKPGQVAEHMYELFPALAKIRKRRGGDLSGGQQQILALARIMATEPQLMILDEPTEGIQPSIVKEIEDAIGSIRLQGVSVLLVEQFVDFALSHADSYYLMEHGGIAREGKVDASSRKKIAASITI